MSAQNKVPPDRGPNPFGQSKLTPRSPNSAKRLFSDTTSPTYVSPVCSKRLQLSESTETSSLDNGSDASRADYCDLVSDVSNYLSKINELVNDQGSRMNVANRSAVLDITQRVTSIVSLLALKSSCNETKLANMQRELDQYKRHDTVGNNDSLFSERLKLRLPKPAPLVESRAPRPCIVACPTDERSADLASSSATKQALFKAIKPSDDGFQIVGVKKTTKGRVVLRVANEQQIKKLESVEAIKSAGLRLEKPKGRRPRILVKDVPSSMEDRAFITALYRQNIKDELPIKEDDFIKSIKIVRRRNLDNGRKWIGIELDSEIRKHLADTKEKLFIDWATCRFIDDLEIVRCMNCQYYGHVQKFCTVKTPTCAVCAEAHETKACPHSSDTDFKPICAPCKRFKKPHDHRCGSQECPTYNYKLQQLFLSTQY